MTAPVSRMGRLRSGAMAGVAATAVMDLGGQGLARVIGARPLSPVVLGRWTRHAAKGRLRHDDIDAASPHRADALIGAITHYAIGTILGAGYAGAGGVERGLMVAVSYGAVTTAFAWLLLFPSMGLGVLGRNAGARLTELSLANHLVFGATLGVALRRLSRHRR